MTDGWPHFSFSVLTVANQYGTRAGLIFLT